MQATPATATLTAAPGLMAIPPEPMGVPPRQRLVAAQLLAAGEAPALAAALAGITRDQLRALETCPDFQELLEACRTVEALPLPEQNARLERLLRQAAERMLAEARVGAVGAGLRLLRHVTAPDPSEPAASKRGWPEVARALADALHPPPRPGDPSRRTVHSLAAAPTRHAPVPLGMGSPGRPDASDDAVRLDDLLDEALEKALAAVAAKAGAPPPNLLAWARSRDAERDTAPGPARAQPDGREDAAITAPAAAPAIAPGPARAQVALVPASSAHETTFASVAAKLGCGADDAVEMDARPTAPAATAHSNAATAPVRAGQSQARKVKSRSTVPSALGSTPAPYAEEVAEVLTPARRDPPPAHPGALSAKVSEPAAPAAPARSAPLAPAPAPGSIEDLAARLERLLAAEFTTTMEEADLADAVCALKWPNWPIYQGSIDLHRLRRALHGAGLDPPTLQRLGSNDFTAPLRDPWHPANRERRARAAADARERPVRSRPDPAAREPARNGAATAARSTPSRHDPAGRGAGHGKAAAAPAPARALPQGSEPRPAAWPRQHEVAGEGSGRPAPGRARAGRPP